MTRAILLADSIITEVGSHKKSLIGIYSRLAAARLPARRMLHVYAQFSDACGEYNFDIELVNLHGLQVLHKGEMGPVVSRDMLLPLELVMHLPCEFEEYGDYELRISHGGNVFASRIFSVTPPPENLATTPDEDLSGPI